MSGEVTSTPTERFEARMQQLTGDPTYAVPVAKSVMLGREVVASSSAAKAGVNRGETGERTTRVPAVAAEPTDDIAGWERAHMAIANPNGWVNGKSFNPTALSGYILPDIIADSDGGTWFTPDIVATLAAARVAEITQQQLETFLKGMALLDGYRLKGT